MKLRLKDRIMRIIDLTTTRLFKLDIPDYDIVSGQPHHLGRTDIEERSPFLEPIERSMGDFWQIRYKLLAPNAHAPTQSHDSDAGWDLYSIHSLVIPERCRETISTGISLEIPSSFVGLIWPRSGLSVKTGIDVLAGVIDSGYRGEIKVCLLNTSPLPVEIEAGDRIAQILFQEVPKFKMTKSTELTDTERKDKGFGSSGN